MVLGGPWISDRRNLFFTFFLASHFVVDSHDHPNIVLSTMYQFIAFVKLHGTSFCSKPFLLCLVIL